MTTKKYLANAFSLQMLNVGSGLNISIQEVEINEIFTSIAILEDGGVVWGDEMIQYQNYVAEYKNVLNYGVVSIVGHQDTANVLGVPMNRQSVILEKGDILYVAQLQGGRLPEGATELPENFTFKFLKVEII